jgi:hypothetical protein
MPVATSHADIVDDWEALLTAIRGNAEKLPDIERHSSALELVLGQTKAMKAQRDSHAASRQAATQELKKLVTQGRELAIRLRGAVKANIGPKSEQLVEFNMKPIRKRPRKAKAGKPPEVTTPTIPPAGTQVRTQVSQPQDSTPEV